MDNEPRIDNAPQDPYLRHSDGEPFLSYYSAVCMVRNERYLQAENRLLRQEVERLRQQRNQLREELDRRRRPGYC